MVALFLIAVLFVMLHAPMVGVLQVLVYAGAIMVLFLFVIMFLNPTTPEPRRKLWWEFRFIGRASSSRGFGPLLLSNGTPSADPVAATEIFGSPEMLGKSLFTEFVLPFEIASVLPPVAIIGAVVLAKREP